MSILWGTHSCRAASEDPMWRSDSVFATTLFAEGKLRHGEVATILEQSSGPVLESMIKLTALVRSLLFGHGTAPWDAMMPLRVLNL